MKYKVGDKVRCISNNGGVYKYVTVGSEYTVMKILYVLQRIEVENDIGVVGDYDPECFELMTPDIHDQIQMAKNLKIGTLIARSDSVGTVRGKVSKVSVVIDRTECGSSACEQYFDKHGFCVKVKFDAYAVPITMITVLPQVKELKLNDSYTAVIHKDRVEVGCQTFPIEQVEEILKLSKEL